VKIDPAMAILNVNELPVVLQISEWPVDVFDIDMQSRPIDMDATGESLPHHLEADHQVSDDQICSPLADTGAGAPGQEFRVSGHIRNQIEHLLCPIGQDTLFRMDLHHQPTGRALW
jgi:hypothetical protein